MHEQVHDWTCEQEQVGEVTENSAEMRSVLQHQQVNGDGNETD